jgi:hypothetical protein
LSRLLRDKEKDEKENSKPLTTSNGFGVQLTETIPIAKPLDNYFGFA